MQIFWNRRKKSKRQIERENDYMIRLTGRFIGWHFRCFILNTCQTAYSKVALNGTSDRNRNGSEETKELVQFLFVFQENENFLAVFV